MQTTRLTSIGSRVEIATLIAVSTVTSIEPEHQSRQHLLHLAPLHRSYRACRPAGFAQVVGVLVPDPQREDSSRGRGTSPGRRTRCRGTCPTMNWRRLIGFESRVIAVLPSISSATVELAVNSASNRQANEIVRQSRVLVHLDVFAEREVRQEDRPEQRHPGDERQRRRTTAVAPPPWRSRTRWSRLSSWPRVSSQ